MKKQLQAIILVVGIFGSAMAFASTPKVFYPNGHKRACQETKTYCVLDVSAALARGGGALFLAALAFGGVSVMKFEDD